MLAESALMATIVRAGTGDASDRGHTVAWRAAARAFFDQLLFRTETVMLSALPPSKQGAVLLAALALVSSCSHPPGDPVPQPKGVDTGPTVEQMMEDLIGRDIVYVVNTRARRSSDRVNQGIWTVGEGELKDFVVVRRFPDLKKSYGERTDEVHALVTLQGGDLQIRGVLVFQYIKLDQSWKLLLMGARDGDKTHDFSFERIRTTDGKVISRMAPANAPTGPWRFAPTTYSTPIPEQRVE
jgi:hypothetical protein